MCCETSLLAMQRAVNGLCMPAAHFSLDGNKIPRQLNCTATAVVKGDSKVASIAAASILAKVTRDRQMQALDKQFPRYGFAKHKGYPTKAHLQAIKELGLIAGYRTSFAPVKQIFGAINMNNQFIHLRVHSEYSLINGLIKLKPLFSQIKELQMPAVAVTDQSFLSSLVKFYTGALSNGIKPIMGADLWIENPDDANKPYHDVFSTEPAKIAKFN